MAFTNYESKEINCKIVYFGPRGSGKTVNLRSIYSSTSNEIKSGLLEFNEPAMPTQFFDFLPVSLGNVNEFHLKLHLYTLPPNPIYTSLSSVILKGIDGYVFVADSRVEAMADNIQCLHEMRRFLTEEGYGPTDMPRVFQYNKRDVIGAVPIDLMRQELNAGGASDQEAVAINAKGTLETLQSIAKQVLHSLSL